MKRNPSITLSPPLRGYLQPRMERYGEPGPTGRVNSLYDRYHLLRREIALSLSAEEQEVVHAMLQGVALNDDQFVIACMALVEDIYDQEYADMLASDTLAKKLESASTAQIIATVDSLGY